MTISRMALTKGQRDALAILAAYPDQHLEAWKRSSTHGGPDKGPPRINMRAAGMLARLRLVDVRYPMHRSPYVHGERYRINEAGLGVHRGA